MSDHADDEASSAEAGAIGGAVAGTGLAGPTGGFIGATLGGLAGAGAEAVEPEEVSPGRVIREPYGHPVAIPEVGDTADDTRSDAPAGPDAPRPVADDDEAPPLT